LLTLFEYLFPTFSQQIFSLKEKDDLPPGWLTTGQVTIFLSEELARPSLRRALEKEQPFLVSKKEGPGLYGLVKVLKKSKLKEKARFVKMALSHFEEEK